MASSKWESTEKEVEKYRHNTQLISEFITRYNLNLDLISALTAECKESNTITLRNHDVKFNEFKKFMQEHRIFSNVTSVTFNTCGIDINYLKIILDNLLQCNNLTKLNLQGNNFGDEGATAISEFFKAREFKRRDAFLKGNSTAPELLEINLLDNGITMDGAQILCDEAPELLLNRNTMLIFNFSDNDVSEKIYNKIRYDAWMYKYH